MLLLLPCPGLAQDLSVQRTLRGGKASALVTPQTFDGDLRALPRPPSWRPGEPVREVPRRLIPRSAPTASTPGPVPRAARDPLLESLAPPSAEQLSRSFVEPRLNFDGQGFSGVTPADPVGDVGPEHYVQMINDINGTLVTIYHKRNGSIAAGPFLLSSLGKGRCGIGFGDPIVLYDQLAGRWLLSEFSGAADLLCVYLSRTSDPVTGGWVLYSFETPEFPDYPKYAVWPEAYFVTTNESEPALYALDRQQMLRGRAATLQRFTVPFLDGFSFQALTPADADGVLAPPPGAPGYFLRHRDDEAHNPEGNRRGRDFLELWELRVDFADPTNSSLTGPLRITVSEFDSDLCGLFSFACFPQPFGDAFLDPLREVVMWRVQYRNFGTYESLVGNFVTDVDGNDHGGIRWFELRKRPATDWNVLQEGTYAPDESNRWMGSIAMDRAGNIALGYSVSSFAVFPGLRYTGRLREDPAGTMTQGETTLIDGQGAQTFSTRWGDYSALTVDPQNDCTFWYTGAYVLESGAWQTRIGSFVFDECLATRFVLTGTNLQQEVCAPGRLAPVTAEVGQVRNFRAPVTLSYPDLPAGMTGAFTPPSLRPPGQSIASVSVGEAVAAGTYHLTIQGVMSPSATQQLPIMVTVATETPADVALLSPPDRAIDQPVRPLLTWSPSLPQSTFDIEIDDDPGFQSLDYTATVTGSSHTVAAPLARNTQYFWRIHPHNACGAGPLSTVSRFTTANEWCQTPRVALPDHDPAGVQDTIVPDTQSLVHDLRIPLRITHTHVGDLFASLRHDVSGITVRLLDQPGVPQTPFGCPRNHVNVLFDDHAAAPVEEACAVNSGAIAGVLRPQRPLSAFDGVTASGPWTLTVADRAAEDIGTFNQWCVRLPRSAGFALRGAVTGVQPRLVECSNETSGDTLRLEEPAQSWDCTAAGFEARSGDSISMRFQGTVAATTEEIRGVAAGMVATEALCRNRTRRESVRIALPAGSTSWNCTAAGLSATAGDVVITTIQGIAE